MGMKYAHFCDYISRHPYEKFCQMYQTLIGRKMSRELALYKNYLGFLRFIKGCSAIFFSIWKGIWYHPPT